MKRRKKNSGNNRIPFAWRAWQTIGCSAVGALLFAAIYYKGFVDLEATVGKSPDPVERIVFSACFAIFFTILTAVWSGVILRRIHEKQSMADIAEDIAKEVAAEALSAVAEGIVGGVSGGSVKSSSGTKGGGGSFGGGGSSGDY
ncbi:MAG: hypothetical protein HZB31_08870 [Nitrospirae bacterium]|nr:hypothetical protein [Nitrospirota bacterium]